MKKLLALLVIAVMVLSVMTACGNTSTGNTDSNTQSNAENNAAANDGAVENNTAGKKFTFKGITFSIPGDFEEKATQEDTAVYVNGTFSISLNYHGETSHETQEEITKSTANSVQKYDSNRVVEVLKNESTGIFYYTVKDGEYNHATCEYIVDGINLSFVTTKLTDEALNAISSIVFE